MKLRHLLIAGALAAVLAAPALADLTYTQGAGTTIFDFLCFTTKHCSAHTPINSAGTEIMTTAAPAQVQVGDGTNQAKVTAASTAAAAADKGVVTNESPNSQISTATGTTADAAATTGSTGTVSAKLRLMTSQLDTINTNVQAAIPACGTAPCLRTIGNVGVDPSSGVAAPAFAFLALPATTTTQIVALSGSTKTYVTSLMAFGGGTVNVTFKYGTGSNCGTGTTTLAGPYPLTAQAGFSLGAGGGAVMIVPAGQALCITTDASVGGGVQLTYQQI